MQSIKPKQTYEEIKSMDKAYTVLYSNPDQKLIIPTLSQVRTPIHLQVHF